MKELAQELTNSDNATRNLVLFEDSQLSHGLQTNSHTSNRFENWFDEHIDEIRENKMRNWIEEGSKLNLDEHPPLNGRNFHSLFEFFYVLSKDIGSLASQSKFTRIDYEPSIQPLLRRSIGLVVVGIFLPMITLISYPQDFPITISGGWLLSYQILLLIASIGFATHLIFGLFDGIKNGSDNQKSSSESALQSVRKDIIRSQ